MGVDEDLADIFDAFGHPFGKEKSDDKALEDVKRS